MSLTSAPSIARPRITLKLATSLDGKIALANGQSRWVTGEAARAHGRGLRAKHDAIAVGANTAILDDPMLTTRIEGQPDPVRMVYDTSLRLPISAQLAQTAKETPLWVFTENADTAPAKALRGKGVALHSVTRSTAGGLDIAQSLRLMAEAGIESLLVEGGGTLIASFIQGGFYDQIHWYRAPIILGGDGRDCVGVLALTALSQAVRLTRMAVSELGPDLHEIYAGSKTEPHQDKGDKS